MKTVFTSILIFFAVTTFAQKSDTLTIPVGKYKFIKVGDKVYKLVTTLEEVKENEITLPLTNDGGFYRPYSGTFTVPNSSMLLGTIRTDTTTIVDRKNFEKRLSN